ncbi:hypothetical protein AAC387_Pa12g0326 [Persea americana]
MLRCIKSIGKVTKKIEEDLDENNDLNLDRGFIEKANLTIISELCSRELHVAAISQLNFFLCDSIASELEAEAVQEDSQPTEFHEWCADGVN